MYLCLCIFHINCMAKGNVNWKENPKSMKQMYFYVICCRSAPIRSSSSQYFMYFFSTYEHSNTIGFIPLYDAPPISSCAPLYGKLCFNFNIFSTRQSMYCLFFTSSPNIHLFSASVVWFRSSFATRHFPFMVAIINYYYDDFWFAYIYIWEKKTEKSDPNPWRQENMGENIYSLPHNISTKEKLYHYKQELRETT